MFSQKVLSNLLKQNRSFFNDLVAIRENLSRRFVGMDDQIHCLVLAVASGESMLMIGPPGTAKSRLVRAFAQMAELITKDEYASGPTDVEDNNDGKARRYEGNDKYFEYLLTPFTEPSELFGFYDIGKLLKTGDEGGQMTRLEAGMMQHAEVVFLDEVFNASSAILNSLLTFVNEKKFHDRGASYEVKLSTLFGATNFPPKRTELLAIFDRFLLRSWAENANSDPSDIGTLLQAGWKETNAADADIVFPGILEKATKFRKSIEDMSVKGELAIDPEDDDTNLLVTRLSDVVKEARRSRLSLLSNRRLIRFSKIFLANALLRSAANGAASPQVDVKGELSLLIRFGLDRKPDPNQMNRFDGMYVEGKST
ncbi:MAG: AAA family ATPase [Lentilitoribacter sp.]